MGKIKNYFKNKWVQDMTDSLQILNPTMKRSEIEKFVEKEFDNNVIDSKCSLANNYIRKEFNTTLLTLIDWMYENKPIVAGYGTFYLNHYKAKNPNAIMLEGFLNRRKAEKSKLKKLDYNSYEYAEVDRSQNILKRNANSFYGASLAAKSQFYNEFVGESITASGQSLISTSQNFFESFIAGNFKIMDGDDLCNYVLYVARKEPIKYKVRNVSVKEVCAWLYPKMRKDQELILQIIKNLTQDALNRLYYTNNIFELLKHDFVDDMLVEIYKKCEDFKVAENVPETIKSDIYKLWEIIEDVVFYDEFYFDRIYRFKEDKRNAVLLCDTDSVISTIDEWVQYMRTNIISKANKPDDDNTKYISISVYAFMLTRGIEKTLLHYTDSVNIPREFSSILNMKNEFLMSRLCLASTKKRYISLIQLREGAEMIPAKFDAKGMDFLKGTTRKATKDFMFELCRNQILEPNKIDVKDVRKRLKEFGERIHKSLGNGEKEFLIPANVKEIEAYTKKPFSNQNVVAVLTWNAFNPNNKITLPDFIDKVNIDLYSKENIELLEKTHPDKYEILNKMYLDVNSGSKLAGKDCKVIGIPQTEEKIPDWLIPFIDYKKIVMDNLNRFNSVNESLGLVVDKLDSNTTMAFNILNI